MSVEHVKQVVGRALMDANFRANLFSNPSHALDGYSLTGEEFQALSHLTPDKLLQMQASLGEGLVGDPFYKFDNPNTMQVDGANDAMHKADQFYKANTPDPAEGGDYYLKVDGIKGESLEGQPDLYLKYGSDPAQAQADYYLKLDGVKGESQMPMESISLNYAKIETVYDKHDLYLKGHANDQFHKEEIEVESFSWGASQQGKGSSDMAMKGSKIGQNAKKGGGVLGILIGLLLFAFLLLFLFFSAPSSLVFAGFGSMGFDPASLGDGSVIPACDGSVMPGDGSVVPGDGSVVPSDTQGLGGPDTTEGELLPAVQTGPDDLSSGEDPQQVGLLLPAVQAAREAARRAQMTPMQINFLTLNALQMEMGQEPMMCKGQYSGGSHSTAGVCGDQCSTNEWCVANSDQGCAIFCQDADQNGTCEGYRCVDADNDHKCDLISWTTCSDSPPGVVCSSGAPQGTCGDGMTCAPNAAGNYVCGGGSCEPTDANCSPTACGNGQCDPNCENGTTCPQDCPTPTVPAGSSTTGGGTTGGSQPTDEPGLCGDQGVSYSDRRCVCPGVIAVLYYCGTDPNQQISYTNETCVPTEDCSGTTTGGTDGSGGVTPRPERPTATPRCQCVYSDPCKNTAATTGQSCPGYYDSCNPTKQCTP